MNILIIYGAMLLVSFGISYLLTPIAIKFAIKKDIIDHPKKDDRRVHKLPIPRVGGLAMVLSMLITLGITYRIIFFY